MRLLEEEDELQEMVRLVGIDALSSKERRILLVSRMLREDYLHQNAMHEIDTYTSMKKQYLMLKNIINFYNEAEDIDANIESLENLDVLLDIARMKYTPEEKIEKLEELYRIVSKEISGVTAEREEEEQ